jgi:acyl carrier protein
VSEHDKLESIFRDVFGDPSLVLTDTLSAGDRDDWDSVAHLNLIIAVEHTFEVTFSGAEISSMTNVGDLKALLNLKISGKRG